MINSSTSPQELAKILGTTYSKLTHVVYGLGTKSFYSEFSINKKNGSVRKIRAPSPQLKRLQQRLKSQLEKLYRPHSAASAFIKNRGIVYNAQKHIRKEAVFNIDLKDFYDQIHFGRVRGLLRSLPYSLRPDTAQLIAHICCVDLLLPQGAPTSPIISNMICRRMDKELSLLAEKNSAYYSRYADDITFSFRKEGENDIYYFEDDIAKPNFELIKIIDGNKFTINSSKVRLQTSKQKQTVTGLKVNRIVNLDRRFIRTTKSMIHSISFGVEEAQEKYLLNHPNSPSNVIYVTKGRINYIGMVKGVHSSVYQMLAKKFNDLGLNIDVPIMPSSKKSDLEEKLHFYGYQHRNRLEKSVWVVSFEDVEGINLDDQNIQGTAFMVTGQKIFTALHTFVKAGNANKCILYRIHEPSKKYSARIRESNAISDIAELEFIDSDTPKFPCLKIAHNLSTNMGYKLSVIGFPELAPGHKSVSIIPCTVINTFSQSTFTRFEIDAEIIAGNSGGPVINVYMQVVGMALTGRSATLDNNNVHLGGSNSFISAIHFNL